MRSIFALNAVGFWKELIQKRKLTNWIISTKILTIRDMEKSSV